MAGKHALSSGVPSIGPRRKWSTQMVEMTVAKLWRSLLLPMALEKCREIAPRGKNTHQRALHRLSPHIQLEKSPSCTAHMRDTMWNQDS